MSEQELVQAVAEAIRPSLWLGSDTPRSDDEVGPATRAERAFTRRMARAAIDAMRAADRDAAGVEALRGLSEAATPGEWSVGRYFWKIGSTRGLPDEFWVSIDGGAEIVASMPEEATMSAPNATLIVAAVNSLRAALSGPADEHPADGTGA